MSVTEKLAHQFDAIHKMSEQAWRDWEHKARYQWKLSFGIWIAQLSALSLVISGKANFLIDASYFYVLLFVVFLHFLFLSWIESRLRVMRNQMYTYVAAMETMTAVKSDAITEFIGHITKHKALPPWRRRINELAYRYFAAFRKPAAFVQISITVLLAVILVAVLLSIESEPLVSAL